MTPSDWDEVRRATEAFQARLVCPDDACPDCCGTGSVMVEVLGPPLPGRPKGSAVGFQVGPCPECEATP